MTWLFFALRNTLRNRRRSLVTLAVSALGTAAILLAGGFALANFQALRQSAARESGHLIIARNAYFDREEDTPLQFGLDSYENLRTRLLTDEDVRYVLPRVQFSGLASNGDKSVVMLGTGVEPQAEFRIKGPFLTLRQGEILDGSPSDPEVMLGEDLARSLNVKAGGGLTLLATTTDGALNALDVRVRGTFITGVPDVDKRLIYTDVGSAQRLLATNRISSLGVFLRSIDVTNTAQRRIARLLGPGYTVRTWRDQAVFYEAVRQLYDRIFGALGLIVTIIVIFVVANATAMSIVERTREIGSLRAMGTLPSQLIRVFAIEGAALGGLGAVLGTLAALTISIVLLFVDIQMPPPPGRSTGYPLQIAISPLFYSVVILGITALAVLSAALVGRNTACKPLIEALNHV